MWHSVCQKFDLDQDYLQISLVALLLLISYTCVNIIYVYEKYILSLCADHNKSVYGQV